MKNDLERFSSLLIFKLNQTLNLLNEKYAEAFLILDFNDPKNNIDNIDYFFKTKNQIVNKLLFAFIEDERLLDILRQETKLDVNYIIKKTNQIKDTK